MYFQFPLMVLIMAPASMASAATGAKPRRNLGATSGQYWRHVALPILMPTLLGDDDPALRQCLRRVGHGLRADRRPLNLVTIVIGEQISGDVLHNVGLGYALAVGMVVMMAVAITLYTILQRRSERWLRWRAARAFWWFIFIIGVLYFFLPLLGDVPVLDALAAAVLGVTPTR